MQLRARAAFALVPALVSLAAAFTRVSDAPIGAPVACSPEEKFCFRFNRLYNPADGKCHPLLAPCTDDGVLVVDREALNAKEPALKAKCGGPRCPRHFQSFFWPRGECLEPAAADVACGGAGPTLNMFGEWECWCAEVEPGTPALDAPANGTAPAAPTACKAPAPGPQPAEDGHCVVPDLWRPFPGDYSPPPLTAPCSDDEFACYSQGRMLFQGKCEVPLERSPCEEGQWLVFDRGTYTSAGVLQAKCLAWPCPSLDQAWMGTAHQCQPKEVIARSLCLDSEELQIDAFGYSHCVEKGAGILISLPTLRENGICQRPIPKPVEVPVATAEQQPVTPAAAPTVPPTPLQPSTAPTASIVLSGPVSLKPEGSSSSVEITSPTVSTEGNQQLTEGQEVTSSPEPVPTKIVPTINQESSQSSNSETPVTTGIPINGDSTSSQPSPVTEENVSIGRQQEQQLQQQLQFQQQLLLQQQQENFQGFNVQQPSADSLSSIPSVVIPPSVPQPSFNSAVPTLSTDLVAPAFSFPSVQQAINDGVLLAPQVPDITQGLSGTTALSPQISQTVQGLNPLEQSVAPIQNLQIEQQQFFDQYQLVDTTLSSNSQLLSNPTIPTFSSLPESLGVPVQPQPNVILPGNVESNQPISVVAPQLVGQGNVLAGPTQPEQASDIISSVQQGNGVVSPSQGNINSPVTFPQPDSSNVPVDRAQLAQSNEPLPSQQSATPVVSPQPGNENSPAILQQSGSQKISPDSSQIVQSVDPVSTLQTVNDLPVTSLTANNANIVPLVSLNSGQDSTATELLQNVQSNIPPSSVPGGQGDAVVNYVLLGQSQVPV